MKKEYTRPGLNVYSFATEDVIATSGTAGGTMRVTTTGTMVNAVPAGEQKIADFLFSDFK